MTTILTKIKQSNRKGIASIIIKGASGSLLVKIFGTAILFFSHIILARIVGTASYGNFVYSMAWLSMLALLGTLGLDNASLRFIAEYNGTKSWAALKGFIKRTDQVVFSAGFIISLITALILFFIKNKMESELAGSFWVVCLMLPFSSLLLVRIAGLRPLKWVVSAQSAGHIIRPVVLLAGVAILYKFYGDMLNAENVMWANFVATIISLIFILTCFKKALPVELRDVRPDYSLTRYWVRTSLPMLFISLMLQTQNQLDIIIIGFFLDSTQVGLYASAKKITMVVSFGYFAINSIAAPMISELWYQEKYEDLQKMLTMAARGIFAFTVPVSIGIIVCGKYALSLFGSDFTAAYWPLVILSIGQAVTSLAGMVGAIMIMTGHQKNAAIIIVISMVLNLILNFIFIPLFSITGAAIATSLTIMFWNISMYVYVKKKIQLNSFIF